MAKALNVTTTKDVLIRSIRWLQKLFQTIEAFLNKVSQFFLRVTGLIICSGGILATVGWLLAVLKPDPLGPSWSVAIWLVIGGVFLLMLGVLALTSRYILRIGMLGQIGILVFLLGAMALAAGAAAVDLFILPWMAKLFHQFPNFGTALQGAYNTVQNGVNSATSTITDTGSTACKVITNPFGGSSSCSTSSTPAVPSQKIPSLGIDDILTKIGLPSVSALGTLGLVFLSGAPLAPGCLLVGLVFLMAGVRPRSSLFLVIAASLLNLGGQFWLHIAFLGPALGVLLFLSMAWFGFTLWFPWKLNLFNRLLVAVESAGTVKAVSEVSSPTETVETDGAVKAVPETPSTASDEEATSPEEADGTAEPEGSSEPEEISPDENAAEEVGEPVALEETAEEEVTASESTETNTSEEEVTTAESAESNTAEEIVKAIDE